MENLGGKISVIVPIYKVEKYLDECIQSIVDQTYKDLEIILVDDGSPDKCPEICDQWVKRDNRIKVIHKENGGLSDARNKGIEVATGDYFAFVDSDDWIASTMYETMLRRLIKENADICACNIITTCNGKERKRKLKEVVGNSDTILAMLYSDTEYPVSAWNKLYRRECWEKLRFPVGKICEDAFTTYLLVDQAKKIVQINDALYYYRIRENSIMTSSFSLKKMDEEEAWRENYKYMELHYPRIRKKSYDFYLQKVNVLIHTMSMEDKEKYNKQYLYLYNILKKSFLYIVFCSKMTFKYRIKFIVDFIKL